MTITVDNLWYIYVFSFLIFALLFHLIGNRNQNAAASVFFAAIIAALLVMVLSKIYIQPDILLPQQKKSLDALMWISWGLAIIFLFWYIFSLTNSEKPIITKKEVVCDADGDCVIIEDAVSPIMNMDSMKKQSPRIMSPIGNFEIKYLV